MNDFNRTASRSTLMTGSAADGSDLTDWELRPGGMLVQKRDANGDTPAYLGPLLRVKVTHGLLTHSISVPSHASFGDLKKLLVQETGLQPQEQRILFKGKVKQSGEYLFVAGVKDKAKLILVEDPGGQDRNQQELRNNERTKTIERVKAEVDKLEDQLSPLQKLFESGIKAPANDIEKLIEKLMTQLLKLDRIEVNGEAKVERKSQIIRVQKLVETLDGLKVQNVTHYPSSRNPVLVTTSWETFDASARKLTSSQATSFPPLMDWERFD